MSRARDLGSSINSIVAGKNLIINGDMNISQRGNSFTTGSGSTAAYGLDRWVIRNNLLGEWTVTKEADAPVGFGSSMKWTCSVADASPGSEDFALLRQLVEGTNLQKLQKGTPSPLTTTVSFWVKSNVVGTYTMLVYDAANLREVTKSYTINSAATWEKKSLIVTGDTSGPIANDVSTSMQIAFFLGAGSTRASGSLPDSWRNATPTNEAAGQVNVASAVNNYWMVTGVQWEIGSSATQFSLAGGDIQGELTKCQRYYQRFNGADHFATAARFSTTGVWMNIPTKTTMRSIPSVSISSSSHLAVGSTTGSATIAANSFTQNSRTSVNNLSVSFTHSTADGSVGGAATVIMDNLSGYIEAASEL